MRSPVLESWTVPVTDSPGDSPCAWKIACPSREFVTWSSPLTMLISARGTPRGLGLATAAQPKMATIAARVIHLGIDRDRYHPFGGISAASRPKMRPI